MCLVQAVKSGMGRDEGRSHGHRLGTGLALEEGKREMPSTPFFV